VSTPRLERAAAAALSLLWFVVLPALLAVAALRWLVPPVVMGTNEVINDFVRMAQEQSVALGVGLFLLFAALARYWRFSLPGARYLSLVPGSVARHLTAAQRRSSAEAALLLRALKTRRARRRLERALGAEPLAQLDLRLAELGAALESGDENLIRQSASAARGIAAPVMARAQWRELAWGAVAMTLAVALALGVRAGVVESYTVLTGSMLPTLQPEDRVAGNRLARAGMLRRGDIIVFKSSAVDDGSLADAPADLVKRVIGLPGDRISMHRGIPVINGWTVPVCDAAEYLYVLHGGGNGLDGRLLVEFLEGRAYLTVHAAGTATFDETYEVQPGEVFVLGDNRNNSSDSRAWNDHHGGGVPLSAVEARVDWFVAAHRADMSWDFGRLFRPVESIATKLHLDGVDLRPVQEGIDRCLQKRPEKTEPPPPSAPTSEIDPGRSQSL
jgi:signal peptidase I